MYVSFESITNVFSFPGLTATMVTFSLWHVLTNFGKDLTLGLNSQVISSGEIKLIIFARTRKQSHVYVLLKFAKNLNFALFEEIQAVAIVVRLSTSDSVKVRSNLRFFGNFILQNVSFPLELLCTSMKAGSGSENVLVWAPLPGPM